MLQIAISNRTVYKFISSISLVRYFFVFHLRKIYEIEDEKLLDNTYRFFVINKTTSKQTTANRFADIDTIAIEYIENNATIHDIGVSNGSTSFELYKKLKDKGLDFTFFVSDKFSKSEIHGKHICKVYDADKNLIMGYIWCLVAANIRYFFVSQALFWLLKKFSIKSQVTQKILLYTPSVIQLIETKKVLDLEYDVFGKYENLNFTFVRCMNLLNRNYFSDNQIINALENIKHTLQENGVLQVGRTFQNGINHVSFYKKTKNQWILLQHYNDGTELKNLFN